MSINIDYPYKCLILWMAVNLLAVNMAVTGQPKNRANISLPPPQLKTSPGGIYLETSWDLDLLKYNYTMPPDNPDTPGDIFNPYFTGALAAKAPLIGEYTDQAQEDRSINTFGADFSINGNNCSDTKVWIYRQTSNDNARIYNPGLIRERADYLVATLDENEPYGMYLMWIENASGPGYPVRINAPKLTWIGPEHGTGGDTINIYGKNLSHNNGIGQSYVYIRKWGSGPETASIPVEVTQANPYKVTFIIPRNISVNTDFEVWIHNGHGGRYGWGGPMKLHIDPSNPYVWNGDIFNVKNYSAKGDGIADDSKAIQAAIDVASDGSRIYFPPGMYKLVNQYLDCEKKLSFEGAGQDKSLVITDSTFSQTQMLFIKNFPSRVINMSFITTKPDGKGLKILVRAESTGQGKMPEGFIVRHCTFETASFGGNAVETGLYGINCISIEHVNDNLVSDNKFTTQVAVNAFAAQNTFIIRNKMFGNWKVTRGNGNLLLSFPADIKKMDISDNFFQSIDHTGLVEDHDRVLVRAIVFQNWHDGRSDRIFIGKNTVDRAGNPWDNSGEIILFEIPTSSQVYNLKSLVGSSMTLTRSYRSRTLTNETIFIEKNKGIGQFRHIVAGNDNQIFLDRPWDIEPDTTSVFGLTSAMDNVVIYDNDLDGVPNYFDQESATSGIQLYGACFDFIIANNTIDHVHHGIYINGFTGDPSLKESLSSGPMNCLVTNNEVQYAVYGLESIVVMYKPSMPSPLPDEIPWSANINTVMRDNQVSDMRQFTVKSKLHGGLGIIVGQLYNDWQNPVWNGPWVRETLIEHNTVTDVAGDYLWFRQHQQYTTARKNVFIDNNKYSNNTGIYFSPQNKDSYTDDNTISGNIDNQFGGVPPGPVLEISERSLDFKTAKSVAQQSHKVYIKNAGTGSLNLSATCDAKWLKTSLDTSRLMKSDGSAILTITINPKLKPGSYSGTVSINGGKSVEEKNIGVRLTVIK